MVWVDSLLTFDSIPHPTATFNLSPWPQLVLRLSLEGLGLGTALGRAEEQREGLLVVETVDPGPTEVSTLSPQG